MTSFTEPTGEAWIRSVNKRLAQLERLPRAHGAPVTASTATSTSTSSTTWVADSIRDTGEDPDPTLRGIRVSIDSDPDAENDPDAPDPYLQEEYDDPPVEGVTDLNYAAVTPSDPIIESRTGGVAVTWDGTGGGGEQMPVNFQRVDIHRSPSGPDFETDSTTYGGSLYTAGTYVFTDQEYGVTWWYRLVSQNTDGQRSGDSAAVSGTAVKVALADVGFTIEQLDLSGTIAAAQAAADAAQAAATNAQATADAVDAVVDQLQIDLTALEGELANLDTEVAGIPAQIETARLNAISTAAADATTKANQAYVDATLASVPKIITVGTTKTFLNPLHYTESGVNLAGSIVIDTPITFGNYMSRFDITGYNYVNQATEIDLVSGGYLYSVGPAFVNTSQTNEGSAQVTIRFARKVSTGTVSIILDHVSGQWQYPKVTVERAMLGLTLPPDSFGTGWTATRTSTLTAYDMVMTPTRRNIDDTNTLTQSWRTTGQVTIDGGKITADTVTASQIAALTITAAEIAAGAIVSDKIAANAVVAGKIAADAVTATTIAAGAITSIKIAASAVLAQHLFVGDTANYATVDSDPVGASFGTMTYAGGLTGVDGRSNWVHRASGTPNIYFMFRRQAGPVPFKPNDRVRLQFEGYLASGGPETITARVYAYGGTGGTILMNLTAVSGAPTQMTTAVQTFTYEGNLTTLTDQTSFIVGIEATNFTTLNPRVRNVRAYRMGAGELVVDGTIVSDKIAANAIVSSKIATDAILANHIKAGEITAIKLAAGTITAASGVIGSIDASVITVGTLDAARIAAGTIAAVHLATGAVTAVKIDAGAVTTDKLAANAVTADKIAANTITSTQLTSTAIDGMTITGALIRTASTDPRIQLGGAGVENLMQFLTSDAAVTTHAHIRNGQTVNGDVVSDLLLKGPATASAAGATMILSSSMVETLAAGRQDTYTRLLGGSFVVGRKTGGGVYNPWLVVDTSGVGAAVAISNAGRGNGQVAASCGGSISIGAIANGASSGSVAVSFPSSAGFTTAPAVVVTPGSARLTASIASVTTTGFNYVIDNWSGGNAAANTGYWIAVAR